jgi:gas vesicle protein
MVFKGLLNSLNKQNKRRQAMKSAQQIAVGVGVVTLAAASGVATGILLAPKSGKETREEMKNKVISFNDAVQKKTDAVKDTVAQAAQNVGNTLKDIHCKTEGVQKDMKDGLNEIKKDVHNTAGNIVDEFNNL